MEIQQLFIQSSAKFLNALIGNKTIQEIVDIGYEFLGNPMFVIDASYKMIACTKYVEVDDPQWYESVENDYLPYDILIENNNEMKEFFRKVRITGYPILIRPKDKKFHILYAGITIENKTIGYLIIPCHKRLLNKEDIQIAELLSNVLSLKMQNSRFVNNSEGIIYEYFISDLLDGNITNPKVIEERLRCIKWILHDNIYVMTLHKKQNWNKSLLDICNLVTNLIYGSKAIVYNNYVVAIISRKKKEFPNKNDLKCLIELLESNEMYGGISCSFSNLSDVCKYLKQSLKSIELGVSMNKKKFLFSYEDYSIYHLMSIFSTYEDLKDFCHPAIFTLVEYDNRYNDRLMESLGAYLNNSTNIEKASNAIGIHRNTMASRIKKIEGIINLNIHDDNILFHLFFSYKVLKFIDSVKTNNISCNKKLNMTI